MTSQSENVVRIRIAEDIILHTDEAGRETLRLEVLFGGRPCRFRSPRLCDHNAYYRAVHGVFAALTLDGDALVKAYVREVDFPEFEAVDALQYQAWTTFTAHALRQKQVQRLILQVFEQFLRPEIPGLPRFGGWLRRWWLSRHATAEDLCAIFTATLLPEQMLKKKLTTAMRTIYPIQTSPQSGPTSATKWDSALTSLDNDPFSRSPAYSDSWPTTRAN